MSTQATINLIHFPSGTSVSGGGRRDPNEGSFAANAVSLTTAAEPIPKGDVITPRYVAVKNYSGDDALISIDGGSTWPFRVSPDNDVHMMRLNFEQYREISTFVTGADTAGSLAGDHIVLFDYAGEVWPWFNVPVTAKGSITYGTPAVAVAATGIINPTGVDNSILYTADTAGYAGNSITIEYIISGGGSAVTGIVVTDNAIEITAGSATTAATVITEVNLDVDASALVTASTSGADTGVIDTVAATNLTGGLNSTSVVVNGTTFTYVAAAPSSSQFSSISDLNAKVAALALITSTSNGTVISIVADTAGTAGNAITLALGANIAGNTTVSGATLTGGTDASTAPTVTTERLIQVTTVENATAVQVAVALAAALEADAQFIAPVPTTSTVVITDQNSGARAPATQGNTGWAAPTVGNQGTDFYDVEIKSVGTSQVVTAVCPN